MRGGVGGQGPRGGQGARDEEPRSVSQLGFLSKDQSGGAVSAQTRWHVWGLDSIGSDTAVFPIGASTLSSAQRIAAGQVIGALPQYFEKATRITRLGFRTNGTTGVDPLAQARIGVWKSGVLGSGILSGMDGSPFPSDRIGQTANFDLIPGGVGANRIFDSQQSIVVQAGSYAWAGIIWDAVARANNHGIMGLRRNALYPIHGWTLDPTSPTTLGQDAITFSVGFAIPHAYTGIEDLPNPMTQAGALLLDQGAFDAVNIPAIFYCREDA